jgi:hypothetical protein
MNLFWKNNFFKFLRSLARVSNSRDQCEIFLRPDWMMPTHALRLPECHVIAHAFVSKVW